MNVVVRNMDVVSAKTRLLSELDAHAWRLRGPKCLRRALRFALALQIPMILLIATRDILAVQHVGYLYIIMSTSAIILGFVFEALLPLTPYDIACILDDRLVLEERLQTAVEVHQRDDVQLGDLLIADAIGILKRIKSERLCSATKLPVEGYYLLTTVGIALLLLCFPAIPTAQPGNGAGVWTHQMSRVWHKDSKKPEERNRESVARLNRSASQISIGKPIFSDTNFASAAPDFASFVKSGGDRLNLLDPDRKNSHVADKRHPYRVSLRQKHSETAAFEPETVSAEEASERITVVENLSKRSGHSSEHHGKDPGQSRSDSGASNDPARSERPYVSEQQRAKGSDGQEATASGSKGTEHVAHNQNGSAETRSEQIEAPAPSSNSHIRDPDIRQPRFGGGQYPHNAPGAGFPEWLRGPEDPHFMDAGQGEGENTGKTNGQPGVGHAAMKEGVAATTIIPPEPKDIHLTGQLQPGDQLSYETDTSGPGAESLPHVPYKRVPNEYEFRAEEELSKDRVPFSYRQQVKAYFSNLR
jgi:hypothetical protein